MLRNAIAQSSSAAAAVSARCTASIAVVDNSQLRLHDHGLVYTSAREMREGRGADCELPKSAVAPCRTANGSPTPVRGNGMESCLHECRSVLSPVSEWHQSKTNAVWTSANGIDVTRSPFLPRGPAST